MCWVNPLQMPNVLMCLGFFVSIFTCSLSNEWHKRISIALNIFLFFSVDLWHYVPLKWLYYTPKPHLWLQTARHVENPFFPLARNKVRRRKYNLESLYLCTKHFMRLNFKSYFISVVFRYSVVRVNSYYLCIYLAWLLWGYCWPVKTCGIEQEC